MDNRLRSLDVFRGLTMLLLIGESTHLYSAFLGPAFQGTVVEFVGRQLEHHPWHGLRFWDLIQPFFMFIVGVALPFSTANREAAGQSRRKIAAHVVLRSGLFLLLGWALYCLEPGRITFRFQNVLAQLSVTYLLAFGLMKRSARTQFLAAFGLILFSELLYRLFPVAGFNQPFVPDRNFGAWVDLKLSGELSAGHWVAWNAVPTAAHTIWGVLAGQWLRGARPPGKKAARLALWGAAGVAAGFALDPVSPVIKRIATGSFVVAGGGFCLLALALAYWLVDIRGLRKGTWVFTVVGMNALFIYLFTESGGTAWFARLVKPFAAGFFSWTGEAGVRLIAGAGVWALLWGMCAWLYRRKIFLKI